MAKVPHAIQKFIDRDHTRQRALLLHYIGESTLNIFDTLSDTGDADDCDRACQALNEPFKP